MRKVYLWLLLAALTVAPAWADDLVLSLGADGVSVLSGELGRFTLAPPLLMLTTTDYQGQKPEVSFEDDNTLLAKYTTGLEVRIKIDKEAKTATYEMSVTPTNIYCMRLDMLIPIDTKAKCAVGTQPLVAFPASSTGQFVIPGQDAERFKLVGPSGSGFTIVTPTNWTDVQDNRQFSWQTFQYHLFYNISRYPDQRSFMIKFEPIAAPAS